MAEFRVQISVGPTKRGKMLKTIILDMDDTLIDFSKIACKCYQETALKLNLKKVSVKKIGKYFGTPHDLMLKELWNYKNIKKFENIVFKKIKEKKVKPIKGAIKVINQLKKHYTLGIISSKNKRIMIPHVKQLKLKKSDFKFIFSKDDVRYHKPDPRVFNKPLRILKQKPSEILYVGDSIFDCIASKKAKIKFVAVLTGNYSKKEFKKYKVKDNNILKSIKDLPKWLEKNG